MADFETLPSGELDDRVRVVFKGFETRVFESYTVRLAVLQQPAVFSVKLGGVEPPHEIFKRYPPGTPFELAIGPQPSFKGYTDGYESKTPSSDPTRRSPTSRTPTWSTRSCSRPVGSTRPRSSAATSRTSSSAPVSA